MLELEARYDRARRSRIFVMESHETPFWGDPADIVELLQAANANVIRFPATAWITTYYPSSYLPQYPGLGDRDLLRDMCDAAQGTGIAVVPYNHIGVLHTAAYREHPEWAATDYDGRPLRWSGPDWDAGLHYATCLSNPAFREAYSKAMAELVANYDPEMIYFDGPVWYLPKDSSAQRHQQPRVVARLGVGGRNLALVVRVALPYGRNLHAVAQ